MIETGQRRDFRNDVRGRLERLPPPQASRTYSQILLAYDGSPGAQAALERVAAIATHETLVTVITVIPSEAVGASLDPIRPELREWQWNTLVEATALLQQRGIQAFIEAAAGNPGPVIVEVAATLEADLVVLGRGQERRWHPSLKGRSLRHTVLPRVGCDTLVVSRWNQHD